MTADSRELIEKLYREYSAPLKARAYKIVQNSETSEDIMHDCFIKAICHIELIKNLEENQRRKYLAVTVDNLAKNYAARNKHELIISDDICESLCNIEESIEMKLIFEEALKTLESMNKHDREIIKMKYLMRLSDREIAPVFSIKENSVRMTVRRSVFNLKKKLGIVKKYENIP